MRPSARLYEAQAGSVLPAGAERERAPRSHTLAKMLVAGLLIAVATGATTVALAFHEVATLQIAISANPPLKVAPQVLAPAPPGQPQTLLLVGNDQRVLTANYHEPVAPHSNEMLLVRIDPSKPWISMMSIPRELWVTIRPPGQPPIQDRINFAYTLGGITLMTRTIKQDLGLSVNHVIVVDFAHFRRAVDQLGCVYSTVDQRYYHSNVGSLAQYQEINLQPGYQKLCGSEALEFVSYRHDDTSLVRDARDQSFMLDVKKQYGSSVLAHSSKYERIFGDAVQTDPSLHTTTGLLNLLTLLAASYGHPVRQVQFQATLGLINDTATQQQIRASVHSFLHGSPKVPTHQVAVAAHALQRPHAVARLGLTPTPAYQLSQAIEQAPTLPFPLEYPRLNDQLPTAEPIYLHLYRIHDLRDVLHPAYVIVVPRGLLGQYYDVQGMNWLSAPLLRGTYQTVYSGPRAYRLYYVGTHVQMVVWLQYGAVYWVRNTLTYNVSDTDMLAIAQHTRPLTG